MKRRNDRPGTWNANGRDPSEGVIAKESSETIDVLNSVETYYSFPHSWVKSRKGKDQEQQIAEL